MCVSFWMDNSSTHTTSCAVRPTAVLDAEAERCRRKAGEERMRETISAHRATAALPPYCWCEYSRKSKLPRIEKAMLLQSSYRTFGERSCCQCVSPWKDFSPLNVWYHLAHLGVAEKNPLTAFSSTTLFQRLTKITYFIANFAILNQCTSSLLDFYCR